MDRRRHHQKENYSSDSPISISDDEDHESLEIKPPQAKIHKHSKHRHSDRHSNRERHERSSKHHHKSHRSLHREKHSLRDHCYKKSDDSSRSYERKTSKDRRNEAYEELRFKERYEEPRDKIHKRRRHHDEALDMKRQSAYVEPSKFKYSEEPKEKRQRHELPQNDRRENILEKDQSTTIKLLQKKYAYRNIEIQSSCESSSEDDSNQLTENNEQETKNIEAEIFSESSSEDAENGSSQEEKSPVKDIEAQSSAESESSSEDNGTSSSNGITTEEDSSSKNSAKMSEKASTSSSSDSDNEEIEEKQENVCESNTENIVEKINLEDSLPSYFPALRGCRSVEEFQCLNRIEEGTYGVVYRAREKRLDRIVALKRLKMENEKDGFPITSLREINMLLKAQHPNIVTVKEIVVGSNMDKIFIVMDYVEHDLKSLMETMKKKKTSFMTGEVKCLMRQLLSAVDHLHDNWILHRDLKTSNLLFSNTGILKVGDFGLAREYGSPLKQYTPLVVTLWYRAPELLLGTKEYSTHIDMWSVGCIFAELLRMKPLFPGKSEIDQLNRIFQGLGTPNVFIWPDYPKLPLVQRVMFATYPPDGIKPKFASDILSDSGYDLLCKLLTYNTKTRITADVALKHEYFSEYPVAIEPAMFATWLSKSEPGCGRSAAACSPKAPSGGQGYKDLKDDDGFYIKAIEDNREFSVKSSFTLKF